MPILTSLRVEREIKIILEFPQAKEEEEENNIFYADLATPSI